MHRKTRLKLTELNPLLTCSLCTGYLIDATTLTECLHSFCRSCLVRYLQTSQHCPKCDTLVHKTRPLHNARVDRVLQNIVYKLVPGLFKDEMKKRRDYYTQNPQASTSSTISPGDLEARGEVSEEALVIYSDDEHMNLSLEYYVPYRRKILEEKKQNDTEKSKKRSNGDSMEDDDDIVHKRYLRCPAAVCVKHIKKFIRNKFDLKPNYQIEITHLDNEDDSLPDDYTLMDVAYIYTWRRNGPLPLVFRVFQEANKRPKIHHVKDITKEPTKIDTNDLIPPSVAPEPTPNDEHSQRTTPPPPKLDKEETLVQEPRKQDDKPTAEKTTDVVSLTVPVATKDDEINNGKINHDVEESEKDLKDKPTEEKEEESLKNNMERTLSNNNESTEVVKINGQAKSHMSIDLKTDVSSVDAPPTLTTVVPAR